MSELLLCGACLNSEADLIDIDAGQLRDKYNALCGVETELVVGASPYLCVMCVAYLNKMMRLRELCLKSAQAFQKVSGQCEEVKIDCTDVSLDITPMLSFPKTEKFTYSEIKHKNNRNKGHQIVYGPLSKTASFCYEINETKKEIEMKTKLPNLSMEQNNSIKATNNNKTKPKVIITNDIKLEVSSSVAQNTYRNILNDNSNNYDTFENHDDMFDTNNSNTSFPDANNADTNNYNADTNNYNADTNDYNADTNNYNADTNDYNADTNNYNADTNSYNSDTNNYNSDTNNYNTSFPDANDAVNNLNDSSNIIITKDFQNNNQNERIVIADSIQLPDEARHQSKKLKIIEYFAKLEFLPDNEARAAHELNTRTDINSKCSKDTKHKPGTKKGLVMCGTCKQLVFSRLFVLHKDAHEKIVSECDKPYI